MGRENESTGITMEDGRAMDFSFSFAKDVGAVVEDVARLSAFGLFKDAQETSVAELTKHIAAFPVAFELLRFSYDQGRHQSMTNMVRKLKSDRSLRGKTIYETWSSQEKRVVDIMNHVAMLSIYGDTTYKFYELTPNVTIASELRNSSLKSLQSEDVLLAVFLLRLIYQEHEVRQTLPVDAFAALDGQSPITLVKHFLMQESIWAAENMLEICFRKTETGVHGIELGEIWSAIEWFFGKSEDECQTWAQIAVLQTFHEGCLRRKLMDITADGVHLTWSWDKGSAILHKLITLAQEQSGQEVWKHSRSRIRQDLISLDWSLWQNLRKNGLSIEETALGTLYDLNDRARDNCDERLLCGVRWRIEVLVNCKDPGAISDTNGYIALPKHIYQLREQLIQELSPTERKRIISKSCGIARALEQAKSGASDLIDVQAKKPYKTILLLGKTGTGKSTLLRTITDRYAATSNSQATTFGVQEEECTREDGTRYRVIDTPGFGDPHFSDFQTFERICTYLGEKRVAVQKLDCLFYLIDVSSRRIEGSDLKQAEAFKRLVGDKGWGNVFFVLTRFVANAGDDPEKLRQKNHQPLMMGEWYKVFVEEVKKGARFIGLGLDFGDMTELEHLIAKTVPPQEDEEYGFIKMPTIASSGDESDSSARKHAYRPASFNQVNYILSQVSSLRESIVLGCQREMCELSRTFNRTQVALSFEDLTREQYDTARADVARYKMDLEVAENERTAIQKELDELEKARETVKRWNISQTTEPRQAFGVDQNLSANSRRQVVVPTRHQTDLEEDTFVTSSAASLSGKAEPDAQPERRWDEQQLLQARRRMEEINAKIATAATNVNDAEDVRKQSQRDIDAIEASAGWRPRIIVHNKSQTTIHLRARPVGLAGLFERSENNVDAGKLRAIHCGPAMWRLEAFLSVPGRELPGESALPTLAAGILGYLMLFSRFVPLWPGLTLATLLWKLLFDSMLNPPDPDQAFRSRVLESDEGAVVIKSSIPFSSLQPEIQAQLLLMEATREGETVCIFQSEAFSLFRCTRLEVIGGPWRKETESCIEYVFDETTKLMRAERVHQFESDI